MTRNQIVRLFNSIKTSNIAISKNGYQPISATTSMISNKSGIASDNSMAEMSSGGNNIHVVSIHKVGDPNYLVGP